MRLVNLLSKDSAWYWKEIIESKEKRDFVLYRLEHLREGLCIKLRFVNYKTHYRSNTLLTKEPETIEWIKKFGKGKEMLDIGANVGVYSVFFSALYRQKCFAFEPSPMNCKILLSNIEANNLSKLICVLPIALSKDNCVGNLSLPNKEPGHSFVHFNKGEEINQTSMPILSLKLDTLFGWGIIGAQETIIKIDVDGSELEILMGGRDLLLSGIVSSILIENATSLEEQEKIDEFLHSCNYRKKVELARQNQQNSDGNISNSIWMQNSKLQNKGIQSH